MPAEKVTPVRTISSDSVPSKDEEVCVALEGLKIAQGAENASLDKPVDSKDGPENMETIEKEADVKPRDADEVKESNDSDDDDDVVVVKHDQQTNAMPQVKNLGKEFMCHFGFGCSILIYS